MTDKLLSMLGLCKKAGKLAEGRDMAIESAKKGKAHLLITAQDISPKSRKEIDFLAYKQQIPLITPRITMDEIYSRTGKRAGILAVLDKGLADTVGRLAENRQGEEESVSDDRKIPRP